MKKGANSLGFPADKDIEALQGLQAQQVHLFKNGTAMASIEFSPILKTNLFTCVKKSREKFCIELVSALLPVKFLTLRFESIFQERAITYLGQRVDL